MRLSMTGPTLPMGGTSLKSTRRIQRPVRSDASKPVSCPRFAGAEETVYDVKLSPDEVMTQLKEKIDIKRLTFWSTQMGNSRRGGQKDRDFYGEIKGNTFRVMKKRWYNNGFAPLMEGTVEKTVAGSRITTRFNRLKSGKMLLGALYGGTGGAALVTIPMMLVKLAAGAFEPGLLIGTATPLGIMGLTYGLDKGISGYERRKMTELMDGLFKT